MQHRVVETFCVESLSFISKRSTINHNGFQCICIFSTFSICWTGTQPDDMRKSVNKREPVFFENIFFSYQFFLNLLLRLTWNVLVKIFPENFFFSKLFLHSFELSFGTRLCVSMVVTSTRAWTFALITVDENDAVNKRPLSLSQITEWWKLLRIELYGGMF